MASAVSISPPPPRLQLISCQIPWILPPWCLFHLPLVFITVATARCRNLLSQQNQFSILLNNTPPFCLPGVNAYKLLYGSPLAPVSLFLPSHHFSCAAAPILCARQMTFFSVSNAGVIVFPLKSDMNAISLPFSSV